jgi:hypothetical protein
VRLGIVTRFEKLGLEVLRVQATSQTQQRVWVALLDEALMDHV